MQSPEQEPKLGELRITPEAREALEQGLDALQATAQGALEDLERFAELARRIFPDE